MSFPDLRGVFSIQEYPSGTKKGCKIHIFFKITQFSPLFLRKIVPDAQVNGMLKDQPQQKKINITLIMLTYFSLWVIVSFSIRKTKFILISSDILFGGVISFQGNSKETQVVPFW